MQYTCARWDQDDSAVGEAMTTGGDWEAEMNDFELWKRRSKRRSNTMEGWAHIGEWLYTTRNYSGYSSIFSHLCEASWKQLHTTVGGGNVSGVCERCNEEVPDGIRMVVLLTEKL